MMTLFICIKMDLFDSMNNKYFIITYHYIFIKQGIILSSGFSTIVVDQSKTNRDYNIFSIVFFKDV